MTTRAIRRITTALAAVTIATLAASCAGSTVDDATDDRASSSTTAATDVATTAPIDLPGTAAAGDLFQDENGRYTVIVDPAWEHSSGGTGQSQEGWIVGERTDGFSPNLNIITQYAGGQTLQEYVDNSLPQLEQMIPESELIEARLGNGNDGQQLAILEYRGVVRGIDLRFYAVATPVNDGVALATFTATEEQFDDLLASVEPALLSLQAA